jgi:hypothetical protein
VKGKAAPWMKEDAAAVISQLRWLKRLLCEEPSIRLLVTHDDELFSALTRDGVIGGDVQV